ncbi:MAG: hypothetical protein HY536_01415 [Candidatus Colwellbacteria bacterium]|nr:hypothetical protein [Candidatus Colwellbacteria bacterium]
MSELSGISAPTLALAATLALVWSVRSPWLKALVALAGAFFVKIRPGLDPLQIYFLASLAAGYVVGSLTLMSRTVGIVVSFAIAILVFEAFARLL